MGSDTSDFWGACYKLLGFVSGVLLTVLVLRHPLLFDNYDSELNDLVPYETHINRQILELNQKSAFTHIGKKSISAAELDKTVLNHVHDALLNDDSTTQAEDTITPLHKTMLLMGCYGNPREIKDLLSLEFMTNTSDMTPPIFYNFMLEAFDQFNLRKQIDGYTFSQPTHDKSVCSCLRDFATPSLLGVLDNNDAKCDPYGTKKDYTYDTCRMQALLDYTIDSSGTPTDGNNKANIILPTGAPKRNLKDPFLAEIEDYESKLKSAKTNFETTLNFGDTDTPQKHLQNLKTFIVEYCRRVNAHDKTIVSLRCPAGWYENNNFKDITLVKNVMPEMKKWAANMRTYNKLRTPSVATLGSPGFKNYIKKYRAGFDTCASFGIQSYSTEITGTTKYVHWYVLGELFLLLAASLSFLWARHVKHAQETTEKLSKAKETNVPTQNDVANWIEKINYFFVCVAILVIIFLICFFPTMTGFTISGLDNDSETNKNYGYFLSGFVAVFIALFGLLVLFMILGFVLKIWFASCVTSCINSEPYAAVDGESQESIDCKKTLFTAQIVQDLPVILGLTFMAVGTTLQRGVSNYNLILTVIVLMTTTGLTTHITNVLRLMSLRLQGQMMKQASKSQATKDVVEDGSAGSPTKETAKETAKEMKRLQFNRVLIGLIIAFMLVVFQNLAGLDSVQGMDFAAIHQTWFAIFAFVILVCGDLSLEFLAVFQRVYKSQAHYLLHSVASKSNNTGWLILISLWLLQLHSRHWLCPRYEIANVDTIPKYCAHWR